MLIAVTVGCDAPKTSTEEAVKVSGYCELSIAPGSNTPKDIVVPLKIQNSGTSSIDIEFIVCGWVTGQTNGDCAQVLSPPSGKASWHIEPRKSIEVELSPGEATNRLLKTAGAQRLGFSVACFSHNGALCSYQTFLPAPSEMPTRGTTASPAPLSFLKK